MSQNPLIAIIGGSGLYSMPGLENIQEHDLDTPFGKPSAPIIVGDLAGKKIAFLARHGVGHHISPSEINFRANIYALKLLGVERVVSITACGSLREDYAPGDIIIPDQLFDFTRDRKRTFFEDSLVAHISIAEPFCKDLSEQVYQAIQQTGAVTHFGGTMITIEGPRFSTRAESNVFRSWGMSLIGMTTSPEAFLAREAELCYTVIGHVTDYDVWHESEATVTVEAVIRVLLHNAQVAKESVRHIVKLLANAGPSPQRNALQNAIITRKDLWPERAKQQLSLLIGKYS